MENTSTKNVQKRVKNSEKSEIIDNNNVPTSTEPLEKKLSKQFYRHSVCQMPQSFDNFSLENSEVNRKIPQNDSTSLNGDKNANEILAPGSSFDTLELIKRSLMHRTLSDTKLNVVRDKIRDGEDELNRAVSSTGLSTMDDSYQTLPASFGRKKVLFVRPEKWNRCCY